LFLRALLQRGVSIGMFISEENSSSKTLRFIELDSLRGLAALSVMICHFLRFWLIDMTTHASKGKLIVYFFLHPISAGYEAVVLFFVLSGLVLSMPAVRGIAQPYPVFLTRRLFRIYFPYLIALVLAVIRAKLFCKDVMAGAWISAYWNQSIDWRLVGQHVLFLGEYKTYQFDPPIWSLIQEMRISLIFPFLCLLASRLRPGWLMVLSVFTSVLAIAISWLGEFYLTLHYCAFFMMGILIARNRDSLSDWYDALSFNRKIVFAFLASAFYCYGHVFMTSLHIASSLPGFRSAFDWPVAIGATALIVLCMNSLKLKRLLFLSPIRVLGEMSYSLYLMHFIVLLVCIHTLYGHIPLLVLFMIYSTGALAVSWVFCQLVEKPFMKAGRSLRWPWGFSSRNFESGPKSIHS
jgi:peptidoglycan/LPS O-acetylase OafA/YrhL